MARERTFSIIKPDATRRNITGAVNDRIEKSGLRIVAQKRLRMSKDQAEGFYAVHKERPFYKDLVTFMTSGPVVVQVLEGENAVTKYREVMECSFFEGLSHTEIALKLQKPVGTVKTFLRRGLIQLRDMLRNPDEGGLAP